MQSYVKLFTCQLIQQYYFSMIITGAIDLSYTYERMTPRGCYTIDKLYSVL